MGLAIRETHINADKGYLLSEPFVTEEPFTEDRGELFRYGQQEFGRCVSKVYVERREYEDDPEQTYLHEVWVELLRKPDEEE